MGLFDFLGRKADDLASKNADAHLRSLGIDMARSPLSLQVAAHRDMCNAMFVVGQMGGKPLSVAECALWKLASIYVHLLRSGDSHKASDVAALIPTVGGNGAGNVRREVAKLAHDFMEGAARK